MWVSNLLAEPQRDLEQEVQSLLTVVDKYPGTIIIVSNEVGWGLLPMNALGRKFCDLLGKANRLIANQAAEVWLLVAGFPLNLVEVADKWRIK
jgi:adenosylcobinamide kinase/adenosylcobinamide-phosphate guanylyltransferase